MRPFLTQKHIFFPILAAILIFCLIAPPFLQACGCACDYGKPAEKRLNVFADRTSDVTPSSGVCCTSGCDEKPSGQKRIHKLINDIDIDPSGGSNPVCCCETDACIKTVVTPLLPKDDHRTQFTELRYQQDGPSAFLPDLHYFNKGSLPGFCRDISPTSPHIASTVLLI